MLPVHYTILHKHQKPNVCISSGTAMTSERQRVGAWTSAKKDYGEEKRHYVLHASSQYFGGRKPVIESTVLMPPQRSSTIGFVSVSLRCVTTRSPSRCFRIRRSNGKPQTPACRFMCETRGSGHKSRADRPYVKCTLCSPKNCYYRSSLSCYAVTIDSLTFGAHEYMNVGVRTPDIVTYLRNPCFCHHEIYRVPPISCFTYPFRYYCASNRILSCCIVNRDMLQS